MDFEAAISHLSKDNRFAPVIQQTRIEPLQPTGNVYFDLLDSIVSQQLSVKAAATIFGRFCALFPNSYPMPEQLLAIESERLRAAGLSNQKAGYLKNVASFSLENNLVNTSWSNVSDSDIIDRLTRIKGVGKWTVEMILIFTLDRPNVFPIDDLGIQHAMIKLFGLTSSKKELLRNMLELSEPWQPYRSTASRLLWRWKDQVRQ
ncbi:MAG: DNA-3-methyladenine glycosylase family protein [Saprospiraceae bacterium]